MGLGPLQKEYFDAQFKYVEKLATDTRNEYAGAKDEPHWLDIQLALEILASNVNELQLAVQSRRKHPRMG